MFPNAVNVRPLLAVPFQPDTDNAAVFEDLLVSNMLVTNAKAYDNGWLCFYV